MPVKLIERTPEAYGYPLLIKQLLHAPLACAAEREIVYRDLRRYSYRTFRSRIGQLATGLKQLGVKPGDTVAVMDWDSHRYLECYFAIPMMGAVLQTVNIRLSAAQILYTLDHSEADFILVHADFVPLLAAIHAQLTRVRKLVLLSDGEERPSSSLSFAAEYEDLLAASSPDFVFEEFDENARATTFYTSGTTGPPKGVYFSHRQLVLHTLGAMAALASPAAGQRFHRGDVYMPITPMFHVHAWGLPYVATALGVKQVYPGRYSADILLTLISKEGVTFSHGVPTLLHMLLSSPLSCRADFSKWKVVVGGAALPRGLAAAARERGIDIFAGYGMSETCPILTLSQLPPDSDPNEIELRTKCGQPIPLVDLRVVDEQMNDLPCDARSTGEIVARAPWLTQGYLHDSENSGQLWRNGFLHTNDLANIDPSGYLQVTDRVKDVIKTGGEWVCSLEIESIISQHKSVSEVAVIGVSHPKWGERPLALVVPKPEHAGRVNDDDIRAYVRSYAEKSIISKWAVPDEVRFVTAIAKTSVGKIDKKTLRLQYNDS